MLEATAEAFEEWSVWKIQTKESELWLFWKLFSFQGKIDNIPNVGAELSFRRETFFYLDPELMQPF